MSFLPLILIALILIYLFSTLNKAPAKKSGRSSVLPPLEDLLGGAGVRNNAWMEAAGCLNLSFVRPDGGMFAWPGIAGKRNSFGVMIEPSEMPDKSTSTIYMITFPRSLNMGLTLSNEPDLEAQRQLFSGLRRFNTAQYFGESVSFVCSSYDEREFKVFFNPVRRNAAINVMGLYCSVLITDEMLKIRTDGIETSPDQIVQTTEHLLKVAEALYSGKNETLFDPEESVSSVGVHPVAESIPPVSVTEHPLESASVPEEKISEFAPIVEPPEPEKTTVISSIESGIPFVTTGENVDSVELAAKLFSSAFPGAAEKAAFDEVAGKQVSWHGVLRTSYEFNSDFTFGNLPGVRATFDLCEVTGNYNVKTMVKVVAHLPLSAASTLKNHIGTEFRFTGKLLKFESFSKEIYLTEVNLL